MNRVALWLAQGFGVGRAPVAPGTFGSLIGLVWLAALLALPTGWFYLGGVVFGAALSVKLSGLAEKILQQRDPNSVVIDEIIAVPVCFASWIGILFWQQGAWPAAEAFFNRQTWPLTLGVFLAFRFFDILKPWPVRQSQALPGGWGVTADDLLAAVYVNLTTLAVFAVAVFCRF